jgi:hypothetical protein
MGYYTSFTYASESEATLEEFAKAEAEHFGDPSYGYQLGESGYAHGKWYDFDEDMAAISKLLPGKLLVVDGEGEEYPDIWRAFFKDGQHIETVQQPTWVRPATPTGATA